MIGMINGISCYSLLQSSVRIDRWVKEAKNKGYQALALADKNNLYAWPSLYHACQREGIKPLAAMQLAYKSRIDDHIYYLLLLAKDNDGLKELYKLTKEASNPSYLDQYHSLNKEHLFFITPGKDGELESFVLNQQYDEAKTALSILQQRLNNRLYMAMPSQWKKDQLERWEMFQSMVKGKTIACEEIKAIQKEDLFLNKVLFSIKEDQVFTKVSDVDDIILQEASTFETYYQFHHPLALKELQFVVEQCEVTFVEHQSLLPSFPVPDSLTAKDYLYEQCLKGKSRVAHWDDKYEKRLHEELAVIHDMGFDDYFLIIWDVLQEARRRHILTSPGRGSAAGSLVAYLLKITDIDPLPYHLLFERFLNKSRQTMPDIDLDFPDYRRDELYGYLNEKYGANQVARIITFGTMAARQVIKDVTKAFGLSIAEQQEWVQAVYIKQHDTKITLKQAYEDSYALRKLVQRDEASQRLFKTALALEGLPKTVGMHAAGVVVTSEDLSQYLPLQYNDDWLLTQWTMVEVERLGLLKIDFLGLKNLTIIQETLHNIKKYHQEEIDIQQIPLDDAKVYHAFCHADTVGIFQFESKGMKKLLQEILPKNLSDLSLINAIHRPGPSLNSDEVVARRFHKKEITYIDPCLKDILKETYGLMIYQEQVMQVAQVFAGYTLNEADNLRRAMGKKSAEIMEQERRPFIERSVAQGRDIEVAEKLFNEIMAFAGYGFNKSHSMAYSLFAYRMMYLKVHYPAAFYLALLKETSFRSQSFIVYVRELQKKNIPLQSPTINDSEADYSIKKGKIVMGLSNIKGIDHKIATVIIEERQASGRYTSVEDFVERLPLDYRRERLLIPLIEAGCFDELNKNRRYLIENLDALIINANYAHDERLKQVFKTEFERCAPFSLEEQLEKEKDRIGAYIATRPMDEVKKVERALATYPIIDNQASIRSFVMINQIREIKTKNKATMGVLEIEDSTYHVAEAVIFPSLYRQWSLHFGDIFLIEGEWKENKYGKQVVIQKLTPYLTLLQALRGSKLYLRMNKKDIYIQQKVMNLMSHNKGMTPVVIVFGDTKERRLLNERYWVNINTLFLENLKQIIGVENVKYYES